jgi:IS30 family transposase
MTDISKETEEEIVSLYKRGATQAVVAKQVGVCQSTVHYVLKRHHVPRKPKRSRLAQRFGVNALDWFDEDIIR